MTNTHCALRRRIIISIVSLLIVISLLYFVPWPTRIDYQMIGAELSVNGELLQKCNVTVKGWKLNYLFQHDLLMLDTFEVQSADNLYLQMNRFAELADISTDFSYTAYTNGTANYGHLITLFMANENSWFLFEVNDRYFAVSVDGGLSPTEIWETANVKFQ